MADTGQPEEHRSNEIAQPVPAALPDIMNDPTFDPSKKRKEKSSEENDTCRICRGEGSPGEPLFYPCKCSGSIKFVHQECLMEWLSHSQKKHCELCKTPFRFTKLYHPQMPSKVPFVVFAKQGALHIVKSFLTWGRWNLVILVWLGWVPWSMRIVWRSLFYIGDGGWITPQEIERRMAIDGARAPVSLSTPLAASSLSSSNRITSSNSFGSAFSQFLGSSWTPSTTQPGSEPRMLRAVRRLFAISLYPVPDFNGAISNNLNRTTPGYGAHRSPSLLSKYEFLNNLTRSSAINSLAIDVLEGQLITLLVVVGFVLVFLIREWVVQQQPVVNAALAFDAAAADQGNNVDDEGGQEQQDQRDLNATEHEDGTDEDLPAEIDQPSTGADELANTWEHTAKEDTRAENGDGESGEFSRPDPNALSRETLAGLADGSGGAGPGPSTQARPPLPHRGALSPASEIRRTLEEEALASGQVWPGVDVFMDLWRRAESDPEEVLRIIRADGRENELSWIVSAMARLQHSPNARIGDSPVSERDPESSGSANQSWFLVDESDNSSGNEATHGEDALPDVNFPIPPLDAPRPLDLAALHQARVERREIADQIEDHREVHTAGPSNEHPEYLASDQDGPEALPEETERVVNEGNDAVELPGEALQPNERGSLAQTIQNWLWGDIPDMAVPPEDVGEDDERIVENLDEEPPFVPVANGQLLIENDDDDDENDPIREEQDPEVLQAAAEAGINPNEPEALDDGEDLEGILELIGAQGPLIGLIQNGLFSALLIAISFVAGIWIPYVVGKVALVFAANPISLFIKMPLRWVSTFADLLLDALIFVAGCVWCLLDAFLRLTATPVGWLLPFVRRINQERLLGRTASKYVWKSADRLAKTMFDSAEIFSDSDVPLFSIVAHESLVTAKTSLHGAILAVANGSSILTEYLGDNASLMERVMSFASWLASRPLIVGGQLISSSRAALSNVDFRSLSLNLNLDTPPRSIPIDYSLAYWSTQDRVIAILIGYTFFLLLGSAYLRFYYAVHDGNGVERPRSALIDVLNQAGGVTKVILIISIEMIVFPLYCGALLDVALLPLFEKATIATRINFTLQAPLTSTFIHWFIGTCYMFHFALFVSMCRRILRTGVLYFIRDPDDPSFHPVRDVLERNVYTQLRKIAFSALVYGGLVIICLGSVVWGLGRLTHGIIPIRWSSSGPVLESPVDLLVYNFVMPFAVTFSEPATVLHEVYKWWFRKCARWLLLTHFMFGERVEDEMYIFVRDPYKPFRLTDQTPTDAYLAEDYRLLRAREIASYYPNGHFVRAPASDQVRLPKGARTFVPVDEHGNRTDGLSDSDQGLHGRNNRHFKKIFIPHNFRTRIAAFLLLLWLFAAVTGVACTMVPLLLGRTIFTHFFPPEFRVNDIYAVAVGAYVLGVPAYLGIRFYPAVRAATTRVLAPPLASYLSLATLRPVAARAMRLTLRVLRLGYFYVALGLLLPAMVGLLWEAYVVIPLLTLSHPLPAPPYTIRFVQSWTLAVVALKFGTQVALRRPDSAAARALRALVSPANRGAGWADPDVRLATRAIVIPACALLSVALAGPPAAAALLLRLPLPALQAAVPPPLVYRYAYPVVLAGGLSVLAARGLGSGLRAWRERVRDDVFLVGERLHNFGERSAPPPPPRAGAAAQDRAHAAPGLERRGSQRVEMG